MGLMLTRLNGGWMLAVGIIGLVIALVSAIRAYRMIKRSSDKQNEERRLAAFMRASTAIGASDGAAPRKRSEGRTPDVRSSGASAAAATPSNPFEKKRPASEEERFREFLERKKK
jgi:hypothetical protein